MSRVSSLYTWKLLQVLETQHVAGNSFRNPKMGCIQHLYTDISIQGRKYVAKNVKIQG
uniref:Uncharacterized protein n=1 Tax=Solanum tuberosum TaxID=4113 RepID=M1AKI9_SOLTU